MNRTPLFEAPHPRRLMTGVALAALVVTTLVTVSSPSHATEQHAGARTFSNPGGVLGVLSTAGTDGDNPFFEALGSNGRSCATCHRPAQSWTITPDELRARFERTDGLDPIFRTNDGANCEDSDVSTVKSRRRAFSLLLTKGVIRVTLDVPAGAEFEITDVDDPYRCRTSSAANDGSAEVRSASPIRSASVYRRPLPTANLKFISAVMWDGRESVPGQAIRAGLLRQAHDAVTSHAQGVPPRGDKLQKIVEFELGLFAAQVESPAGDRLDDGLAIGGPLTLAREPFCIGINDPLDMLPSMPGACASASGSLDPFVFRLFRAWTDSPSAHRHAVARGEAIFNTRPFVIDNVAGLNGGHADPVRRPLLNGTCTVCHDTPAAGNHSVPMALNIGVAEASRRPADLPLYTVRHLATGHTMQTTDPGRAMVTGKWSDIGKFKGPVLRGLAARPPFFHDGSAATLADVIRFYDTRFQIRFTQQEKSDLMAFLQSL